MKTLSIINRNHRSLKRTILLCVVVIALALGVSFQSRFAATAMSTTTDSTIVLQTAGAPFLQGTLQVVNNGSGNQTSPHVDCDVASYTNDDLGYSTIHYQSLSTGADNIIPGNLVDLLSDISGSRIAYTEVTNSGDTIRIFDTNSQSTTVVPGFGRINPSIGGNLIAFEDGAPTTFPGPDSPERQVATYDLSTGTVTSLTNDGFRNINPKVSPNGDAVVWEKCQTNANVCDVYAAIQTSPGVFSTRAVTAEGGYFPSTNGQLVVYVANRTGENDIYYQPLAGGPEVHLAIPDDQRDATISGDLISFESGTDHGYDIFVYDISSGRIFQVTNTLANEKLSELSVCGNSARIVYVVVGNAAFDAYAFTFQVPNAPANQIDDLMALIRSFNLPPGPANSLITKLQQALTAIESGDIATACSSLTAFANECAAQSGKKLTTDQATQLINSANQIKSDLGCP